MGQRLDDPKTDDEKHVYAKLADVVVDQTEE